MRQVRSVVLVLVSASLTLLAQTPSGPAFEVASVKQNTSGEDRSFFNLGTAPPAGVPARPGFGPPGMVTMTNADLRMIITQAYQIPLTLQRFTLVGGSEKILSARFDIRAKPPADNTPQAETLLMLRTLLADRFKLRMHTETRQVPIYAIAVAREGKLGPDIRESRYDCAALIKSGRRPTDPDPPQDSKRRDLCWRNYDFGATMGTSYAGPMSQLVSRVQPYVDRPVVDATGRAGNYEWQLTFTMRQTPDSDAASIFTALQEQLGLKLESRTGPFNVFVIDSVEMPTPD
jgi:uncharacterized protein (TIGR03435 family)